MSTPVYVTKFGNIQGINAGVEAYVNQQIKTAVEPLITGVNTSIVDAVPRYIDNTGKKVESTPVTIENIATLYVPGGVNIGDRLATLDYYLPGNRGTIGQIMTMTTANSSAWEDAPPATLPTYTNELTVTTLAQGTSSLSKTYIFPTSAPSIDNTRYALTAINIGSSIPAYIDVTQISTFSFLVTAVNPSDTYAISFAIGIGRYGVSDFIDFVITNIRSRQQSFPAVTYSVELYFSGSTFSINIPATTPTPINFVSFSVAPIAPSNLGNGLLGGNVSSSVTFTIGTQLFPNPAPTYVPSTPPARDLEWYPTNLTQSSISSDSGTSSIQCNEVGDIAVNGSLNMGSANINNVNSLTSFDSTLTASCGQSQLQLANVADGLSPSTTTSLSATDGLTKASLECTINTATIARDSVPRVIVDNDVNINDRFGIGRFVTTGGYTSVRAGTGTDDRIDIDGLGFYVAVQSQPVIYIDPAATTSRYWSPDTSHVFAIENGNGVRINGTYYLPSADGTNGQVLTTDGAGQSSWATPRDNSKYSITSSTTYNSSTAETSLIGAGQGSLTLPIGLFPVGASYALNIYGTVRTSGPGQTIRFRLKSTSGTIADTGLFSLTSLGSPVAFTLTSQFTYTGGTSCTGSISFNWNGSSTNMITSTLGTFNSAIAQTINLTAQWSNASANNSIISTIGTLTRVY